MALLAGACSRKSGGGVKLKADTDSVAYIIGMNVGMNLLKMDSTLNVNAVCEGIRDVFRAGAKLSADDAEVYYLRYMNYVLPEKARAYEEQFLADFAKALLQTLQLFCHNRSFCKLFHVPEHLVGNHILLFPCFQPFTDLLPFSLACL